MVFKDKQAAGRGTGLKAPWVLIADDDPSCLAALERAFRIQGFCPIGCSDGREAWAVLVKHPYISMAVLNWMLPNLDGHEICRRLKRYKPAIVSVLMVGEGFLSDAWTQMDLQARHILTKPFPETGIDQTISRIARKVVRQHGLPCV